MAENKTLGKRFLFFMYFQKCLNPFDYYVTHFYSATRNFRHNLFSSNLIDSPWCIDFGHEEVVVGLHAKWECQVIFKHQLV